MSGGVGKSHIQSAQVDNFRVLEDSNGSDRHLTLRAENDLFGLPVPAMNQCFLYSDDENGDQTF